MVAGRLLCVRRGGAGVLRNRGAAVVGRAERHQWKRCACLRVPQRPSSTTACAQHRQARRQHHQPADDDVNKAAASSGPALHEAEEEDGGVRECIRSIVDNGEMKAVGVTPGLFTNMRLLSSDGFPVIEEEARAHMNALVREMKDNHSRGHHEKALESVDHISHVLCKVLDLCEFVLQVHPSAEYRDAAANSLYSLGHDMEVLNTDVELYQALKAFEDMPSAVEQGHETQYTARSLLHDFEKCGIHLPDRERDMVVQRVVELEQLRHQVESQQMSSLGGADIISSRDVPHIPLALRSSLTALPNGDRVSVPYGDPGVAGGVLALSSDRRMRQRADTLRHHTDSDLDDTMLNMLKKRHELARLVGYEDSAHKELGLSMARTPTVAREFLNASRANLVPHVNKEMDQLLALAKDDGIHSLQQWDIPYYVQCLKQGHRAVHDASAYFTIGNCFAGIDYIIHRLFGLRLQPQMPAAGEVWHEDVIRFDVVSEDASGGDDVIGSLYCDLFMRVPKNTHPSHYTIRSGRRLRPINADGTLGEQEKPICALVCGFAPGASGLPYQQALSLFHEFGHALHSLLSDTMYQHVAGTRGSFDFAELPSSLFEYFLREYDVVSKFAVHPHTKKPISRELHAAMIQESTRFWAIDAEHTLFLAALDQHYHSADFMASPDLQRGLQRISEDYLSTLPDNVPRYRTFRHLTSYASSYYSYPWCQAMAGFIWSECFQSRPLDRHTGERYREHILAPGSSGNEWRRIEHMIGFKPSVQDLAEGLSRP